MKKLLLFALIVASLQLSAQQMLVGSYNIRYKNANDSLQGEVWAKRCQVICDQVNFMAPDVFGTQEAMTENKAASMKPSFIRKGNYAFLTMAISG